MSYTDKDARFDAEAQGKCPLCRQFSCEHCPDCGRKVCKPGCRNYESENED